MSKEPRKMLSVDIATLSPSVSKSNNTQTQLRLPHRRRPTAQSLAPCRLSRDKLRPLDLSLFNFTLYSMDVTSILLLKLNKYENQRSVSRLQIKEY